MAEVAKAAPAVVPPPAGARKMVPLQEMRFKQREILQNEWAINAPKGTTIEDMLTPTFWAHVASKVNPRDKITIMTDDCRMYVELIVFAKGQNWLQVQVFGAPVYASSEMANASMADDYRIEYGGLQNHWQIVRVADGRLIKSDGTLKSEQEARLWLNDYKVANGQRNAA